MLQSTNSPIITAKAVEISETSATVAVNVVSIGPPVKSLLKRFSTPPVVMTGSRGYPNWNRVPFPVIGAIGVTRSYAENAPLAGPSSKSKPDDDARENPTDEEKLFTNVRVGVTKLDVPTPAIEIDAVKSFRDNPPVYDPRAWVSAESVIVKRAFEKLIPPIVPVSVPVCVKVIVLADALAARNIASPNICLMSGTGTTGGNNRQSTQTETRREPSYV